MWFKFSSVWPFRDRLASTHPDQPSTSAPSKAHAVAPLSDGITPASNYVAVPHLFAHGLESATRMGDAVAGRLSAHANATVAWAKLELARRARLPVGGRINHGLLKAHADPDRQLQIINLLLAKARAHAVDEVSHYRSAAIIEALMSDGRTAYFLDVNHQHRGGEPNERHCSEIRAIKQAVSEDPHARITQVWIMGGTAENGNLVEPHVEGNRYPPCGSCLQFIYDYRHSDGTRIHLMPVNRGDLVIRRCSDDGLCVDALPPNACLSKSIVALFPHARVRSADGEGFLKNEILRGFHFLRDGSRLDVLRPVDRARELARFEDLAGDELMREINEFMQRSLKRAYQQDPQSVQGMGAAVARLHDGTYRAITLARTSRQSSTISPEYAVLTMAVSENPLAQVTDLFITHVDMAYLKDRIEGWRNEPGDGVDIIMPRGDARMRISKFSSRLWNYPDATYANGDPVNFNLGAMVHMIPLNDASCFNPQAIVSLPIRSLLSTPYIHPRMR